MKYRHILSFLFVIATAVSANARIYDNALTTTQKLVEAKSVIERFYVEPVDADTLVSEAIRAMAKTLDPHSVYSTVAETREFTEPLDGKFSGIGIQFNIYEDSVYVIQPTNGGPSERVGILPGDRIVSANDTILSGVGMSKSDIMKHLRGPKGTLVVLRVRREAENIVFNVVRDDIPIYSVDESFMADATTGYIRVTRYAENTAQEVAEAMDKLSQQGMKNLIIDLSDNGGGYLGSAYEMAGFYLPKHTPIVSTAGRAVPPQQFSNRSNGFFTSGRIVVIVNQNTASAAEIFTGAIQDNDRGLVVGRRTFGKGLVQRPFQFDDGSMLRLTVSRYYTPSGRCIQKEYSKGHSEDYFRELYSRYQAGELWDPDSIAMSDSLRFYTLNNGRTVYGGGGIIPDMFIPADTSYYSTYYRDMVAKGIVNRAVVTYVDRHREELLRAYPDADSYSGFTVPQSLLDEMVAEATDDGIEYNDGLWQRSKPLVTAIVKGLISRDLYENGSYYRYIAPLNPDFNEALSLIHDDVLYPGMLAGTVNGFKLAMRRNLSVE